ncbi:MAG TPA: aminopeptidase [Spirochaetia bacterium]|nr:MAG: aminopeptidase [Spirochaetes bacterium GWB1_36_13]HCL56776.1 aminopeptidase [Spirochaetia bacterium]
MEEKKKQENPLVKKYKSSWELIEEEEKKIVDLFGESYIDFISYSKTERKAVEFSLKLAQSKGFQDINTKKTLKAGDKVYFINRAKNILLAVIGKEPLEKGFNLLAAHVDAPRLDLKPNPLYEDSGMALLKTHYYGGIKKYQWAAIPLALYGVVINQKGEKIDINIGDDPNDPIFYISDLLIHLAKDQMKKSLDEGISGEDLNVLCGSIPLVGKEDEKKPENPIKENILNILNQKYGITEEELVGSEFEIVPAGLARYVGFDKSLIAGYGHDDRSCSFASLRAVLDLKEVPDRTSLVLLADKEEIGSYGNTGLESDFLSYAVLELMDKKENRADILSLKRVLKNSMAISADVGAAVDPNYPGVEDKKNACYLSKGVILKKYTGSRGKSGASDANAEFISMMRNLFTSNEINWQTGELGKVDQGGGGTVAFLLAKMNMDVLDVGLPVLSMHAPTEVIAKIDLYMAYKAYRVFLEKAGC